MSPFGASCADYAGGVDQIIALLEGTNLYLVIGIGAAALIAVIGWIAAGIAHRRARKAAQLAKSAHDLASEAVRNSRQAREAADQASELGASAVAMAEQQERRMTDSSRVEWSLSWDDERRGIVVSNVGTDSAFDVHFVVDRDGRRELSTGLDHVPRDGQLVLPLPQLVTHSAQPAFLSAPDPRLTHAQVTGAIAVASIATVDIRWSSKLGNLQRETLKIDVR